MSSSHALADVHDAVLRHVARHPDDVEAVHALRVQLQHDEDVLSRSNMRGHITTSALVLDAALTHALVVHHRVFDMWLQPGGHYEPPGSLWQSACREVAEETGLREIAPFPATDEPPAPFDIDTHPIPARAAKAEAAHRHHDIAYLAVAAAPFVATPQIDEVHAVRWVALDQLARYPNARLRRLAAKALRVVAEERASAGRSAA
jgi:8-oxo-dGTP pyrophosphatase MutT (NUDIX family)